MQISSFVRITIICIFLFITFGASARSVFIVDSYHASFPWTEVCRQGFEKNIGSEYELTYYEMDTKRIHKSEFAKRADAIWEKIIAATPDLIVTMDDNALKYLGQRIADAGFPLVFMGVNQNPRAYFRNRKIPPNVAGILEYPLFKQNIAVISSLLPMKNSRILLMMDNGTTSNGFIKHTLGGMNKLVFNEVTMDVFQAGNYSEWQAKVRALSSGDYDAFIIGSYAGLKDKTNRQVPDRTISEWTSLNSKLPMFTFWSHGVAKGRAVGGLVISGYNQGASAADKVNKFLKTGSAPYVETPKFGELIFSEGELSRWGIVLPPHIKKRSEFVK